MSLINRISLTNYANVNGSDRNNWLPLYTHTVVEFGGRNGIIVIDNGGGKTTMVNAVIGLLSRHKTLVAKMREMACPSRAPDGERLPWSHIQVELVAPNRSAHTADLMEQAGNPIAGKTMVFGVVTHCDSDAIFYCYPGKLEDLPTVVGDWQDGGVTTVTNEAFRKAVASMDKSKIDWNMTLSEWRHKMSQHFPEEMLKGLAQFQLRGGQDRGAQMFAMLEDKKKSPEEKEEALFYEVLAPELMYGLLEHPEGDPDKGSVEKNLFEYLRRAVTVRRNMEQKKKELQEKEETLSNLERAGEAGKEAHALLRKLEESRRRHALDLAVMDEVVRTRPMPGVPKCASGHDECSALANRLAIIPGEHYPRVPDHALSGLLRIKVRVLNQSAIRIGETGDRNAQVIEIPCDSFFEARSKRGPKPTFYTPDQARKILLKQGAGEKVELLEEAIALFDREMDTNPWREDLAAVEAQIGEASREINHLRVEKLPNLQRQENDLLSQQKEVQANQYAFAELEESGLFSADELAAPRTTGERVKEEAGRWETQWDEFRNKSARLRPFYEEWRAFQKEFGGADPAEILAEREAAQRALESRKEEHRTSLAACDEKLKEIRQALASTDAEKARHEEQLAGMERLAAEGAEVLDALRDGETPQARRQLLEDRIREAGDARTYHERWIERMQDELRHAQKDLETLQSLRDAGNEVLQSLRGGETPADYEKRLRDEKEAAWQAAESARRALEEARKGVAALARFEAVLEQVTGKWAPETDPLSWFQGLDDLRARTAMENEALDEAHETLKRQLAALEEARVAATGEAHKALALLGDAGIAFQQLHEHILEMPVAVSRKAELLDRFSPFLFAPVVDALAAENAARLLYDQGLSVPVFIASRLTAWCEGKMDRDGLAWQALHTRAAEFLLEPESRRKEIARIESRLEENRRRRSDNAALLADIAPQGELLQAWPAAKAALNERYRERLPEIEGDAREANERLARYEQLLSESAVRAIRAAQRFWEEGGESRLSALRSQVEDDIPHGIARQERLRKQAEEAEAFQRQRLSERRNAFLAAERFYEQGGRDELKRLRDQLSALKTKLGELNEKQLEQERKADQFKKDLEHTEEELRHVLLPQLYSRLSRMADFVALGGPAFMEAAPVREQEIKTALERAKKRNEYARQFEPAQKWVEYQKTLDSGEGVESALARIRREIEDANHEIAAQEKRLEEWKGQRAFLKDRVAHLDDAALTLLSRYPGSRPDNAFACDAAALERHSLWNAVEDLRSAIDSAGDDDIPIQAFETVTAAAERLDLKEVAQEISVLERDLAARDKSFMERLKSIIENRQAKGLAVSERDLLAAKVRGAVDYPNFERFLSNFREATQKQAEKVHEYADDEEKTQKNLSDRIGMALSGVRAALTALRKVARQDPPGMQAHFDISAKIISDEDAKGVIEELLKAVDLFEQRREEDQRRLALARNDDAAQREFRRRMRNHLFRSIFTQVRIKYVHEGIRPSGDEFSIGESVSTGEGAALGLMLMIRLARFRIEREARRAATTIARRKILNSTQTLMIVDGLFSNLSSDKLVRSVMSSIPGTRGEFQMIGLVHDPKHQHDFESFPVLFRGMQNRKKQIIRWQVERLHDGTHG